MRREHLKRIANEEQIALDDAVCVDDRDEGIGAVGESKRGLSSFTARPQYASKMPAGSWTGMANRPRKMSLGAKPAPKCAAVSDDTPRRCTGSCDA